MKIRLFNRYWPAIGAVSFAVELGLLLASFSLAHRLRSWVFFGTEDFTIYTPVEFLVRALVFILVLETFLYINGLYEFSEPISKRQLGIRLLRALFFSSITLWTLFYILPAVTTGRGVSGLALLMAFAALSAWRLFLLSSVRGRVVERILIIGSDDAARGLAHEVLKHKHQGYEIVGFLADDPALLGVSLVNPRVIGTTAQACELALANDVHRVVVAQQDNRGRVSLDSLLDCKTNGIVVDRSSAYYEKLTGRIMLDQLRIKSWLVFSQGFLVAKSTLLAKRSLDICASVAGLLVFLPVMALIGLAIRLESKGHAIYRQVRVGRGGKTFKIVKFRSMHDGAEEDGIPQWAAANDGRVTRLGRFLRSSRLDELPQLWNVLLGHMSLVGPRPERPEFVKQLITDCQLYERRLAVRPGITGWAQINAEYAASFEASVEKLEYDLFYIKNLSFFLDLSILASTLRIVLLGRGSR